MEKQLNLVLKLSLNEMALRRVAVNLWSESLILAAMQRVRKFDQGSSIISRVVWEKILDWVKEKVSELVLPESLKERMMHLVRPVGREIVRWKLFHEYILNDISDEDFDIRTLEQLCWTCTGAVDYRKTSEELVRLEILDIEKRYRLACLYCLEDYIPVLWVELPEKYKRRFNDEAYPLPESMVHLEYYWASVLKGEEFKLNDILPREFVDVSSTYQSYFKYSACEGSKAATEYFFQKLTNEERNNALYGALCAVLERATRLYHLSDVQEKPRSDVFCYLLSLMTREQRMQVFKKHPSGCLIFFLDWPWQDLCLDITVQIWNFLPESQYDYVLDKLENNIFISCYFFPDLFQKFFIHSPSSFRKYFVDHECRYEIFPFFSDFVDVEDAETIKVVLGNLDSGYRMRLLSNNRFFNLLFVLMSRDKWHLVELCVGEAMLSEKDREILKEAYMGFHTRDRRDGQWKWFFARICSEDKWKRFFELLDGTSTSTPSTKCSEDETLRPKLRDSIHGEKYDSSKKLKRL
ncbi:hypothetical protein AVEN_192880-1 [Araneus ventricosus]|uniref:Uncharacterized protein n=1 Tax=Araneus ventricosus TaxID=182803 RepID=A0A4Y2PZT6_ARAVE|nr:hypothetical protein AVEN_192880-1 [Araneus ventricosus]